MKLTVSYMKILPHNYTVEVLDFFLSFFFHMHHFYNKFLRICMVRCTGHLTSCNLGRHLKGNFGCQDFFSSIFRKLSVKNGIIYYVLGELVRSNRC